MISVVESSPVVVDQERLRPVDGSQLTQVYLERAIAMEMVVPAVHKSVHLTSLVFYLPIIVRQCNLL